MQFLAIIIAFLLIVFFPGIGDAAGVAILLFVFTGKKPE